jgi:phosphate-selective porin OprO/OprP
MELKEIPFVGNFRIGQFKSPFSLEYMTSSKYLTFMERGLNTEVAPRRNTGFMLHNNALDKRMKWAASIYRTADDFGDSQGDSTTEGGYSFAGRITGLPWYKDNGKKLIHMGFSYSYQNAFENKFEFDSEAETDFTEKFVSTGEFAAEYAHLYNPELALVFGPFSLQTEYTYVHVNTTGSISGQNPDFTGFYVYGSYFLTGEHRKYDKKDGEFGRVRPNNNFNWGKGLGAVELAARYSELDLSDKDIEGGRLNDVTLGLNWYLNPSTRVMFNYVHADLDLSSLNIKNGNADIASVRFQIDF